MSQHYVYESVILYMYSWKCRPDGGTRVEVCLSRGDAGEMLRLDAEGAKDTVCVCVLLSKGQVHDK